MKLLRHLIADLQDAPIDLTRFAALSETERYDLTRLMDKISQALSDEARRNAAIAVPGRPEPEFKIGDSVRGSFMGVAEIVDFTWWNHTQRWSYRLWSPTHKEMFIGTFYDGRKGPAFHSASTIFPADVPALENIA